MATGTDEEKVVVLESLLSDARAEADELRRKLDHYNRIITSTRLVMGHELKKPTTAISGYLDLACEDLEKTKLYSTLDFLDKARAGCELLNELNEFYLQLLRIDADEEEIGWERVDIEMLVKKIIEQFPDDYKAVNRVAILVANDAHFIRINPNMLKLIVMNLLENALLYAQVETPIRVEVERTENKRGMAGGHVIHIRVIDEGVGIPDSFLKRIFSPFVRLREDMAEGAGLGLTLVRSLVELNGGDIFIRSGEERGTIAHVTLPAEERRDETPVILL
ncbi:MAG: HAMP domain-containing histidine kinase [Candidatus Krumholzibacteriota bacterium]|nr:HAMP domain-containing histidine kinase [Candidatus Krumholzibacteriota bacterium]